MFGTAPASALAEEHARLGAPPFVPMISTLLIAWCLLALTVTIHAAGLSWMFRRILSSPVLTSQNSWRATWELVRYAWWLVLLHLAEIAVWALFYWWRKCLPDAESSFYFSAVTYTTVGYGDLVLPAEWRMLGAVEGLVGILMSGLSTGFFFAVVGRMYASSLKDRTDVTQ